MSIQKTLNTKSLILCALFSALIAVGAFIKIPVPIVPFSLQFLFTAMAGMLLGRRLGAISVAVYIAIGLLGIPVFTSGGGIGYIFKPTFGYIIGFLVGAYVTGAIAEKESVPSFRRLMLAGLTGLGIVYSFGMIYYYFIANYYMKSPIGIWSLFLYCFLLFVPGDLLSCYLSALLSKRLIPLLKRGHI